MKRILIAVALAAAVLGTAVFEFFYVGGRADSYTARITQIDAFLKQGDAANALDVCRAVERDWDDETGKIYTLLIHDYADNIGSGQPRYVLRRKHRGKKRTRLHQRKRVPKV